MERKTLQGGPVRARDSKGKQYSPYIEEQAMSGNKNTRRRGNQQQKDQERKEERILADPSPWSSYVASIKCIGKTKATTIRIPTSGDDQESHFCRHCPTCASTTLLFPELLLDDWLLVSSIEVRSDNSQ
ncbi:hypothetical protein TNCV_3130751 [Trichonephila clavipes]|nr:hypothetical protein TNCV_3130751 [Trichonephila clavipes]